MLNHNNTRLTMKSLCLLIFLEFFVLFGGSYCLYITCNTVTIPMWLYKLSFIVVIVAQISSFIMFVFKKYWKQDLDSYYKANNRKMKIYGNHQDNNE